MSWLALRRLRTGPTVLVRDKPSPDDLLEIATLADPAAHREGDDVILSGARIAARVELTESELAKLSITDEERLWALRVIAQGPQPVDYFDRLLAEGVAYRLEGWSMTQGVLTDPAEDDPRDARVYLPDLPDPEEFRAVLRGLVAPVEEVGASWPEGAELEDGLIHVPGEGQILYGGADVVVAGAWQKEMPTVVRARVPYATEIVALTIRPIDHAAEAPPSAEAEPSDEAEASDAAEAAEEAAEVLAEEPTAEPTPEPKADVEITPVALALAEAFNGVATDRWGFEITA